MPKFKHLYVGNLKSYVVHFDFCQIYPLHVYALTYWVLIFRIFPVFQPEEISSVIQVTNLENVF